MPRAAEIHRYVTSCPSVMHAGFAIPPDHVIAYRSLIRLQASCAIVQDDSGIPLTYFEATTWRVLA
jgi:hypothetical protein